MKKFLMYALMVPVLAGTLFACATSKTDARQLAGKWNITEVKGEKVVAENTPFMEFDMNENKLHGNAGCNIFNTSVTLDDKDASAIRIAQAMTTMMACPDLELENKILQGMDAVRAVKAGASENEMQLVDEAGNVLFVLVKQ